MTLWTAASALLLAAFLCIWLGLLFRFFPASIRFLRQHGVRSLHGMSFEERARLQQEQSETTFGPERTWWKAASKLFLTIGINALVLGGLLAVAAAIWGER